MGYRKTAKQLGSKFLIAVVFLVVSAFILLCPLLIHSPCLIDVEDLKAKPDLFGHRGAPMLAPENTLMSFNRSATECNVKAFETDVQLSKDRIPFLMHDHKSEFLKRTTNITKNVSCGNQLTFDELKTLNAGEWFVEKDPFYTVHLLTENQKNDAKMQAIPSLQELLELAKQHNTKVIFDLYHPEHCDDNKDTVDTVTTILRSGIDQKLIYWLPPKNRDYVKNATDFIQIYGNESEMFQENGSHLNVKYSQLTIDKIRKLQEDNIKVNLYVVNERWLFSLLWCAGASSVTTNSCQVLNKMRNPDWTMAPSVYRMIWILVDVGSILTMIGLFVYQWKTNDSRHREGRTNVLLWTMPDNASVV
ncbi:hypothetical protein ILYODFUR_012886 [Ilyodon furcidens]|uniref:GP-PDE domain-containing protein n=1 Tax=Ilyodon furcidens TaxID=33524 RepID=A0ABV0VFZ7_9TELE